jgi:hypothetical protein
VRKQQVEELEILSSLVPFITASKNYIDDTKFKVGNFKLLLSQFRLILAFIYNQNANTIPDASIDAYDPQNDAGLPPVASRQQAARELGAIDVCIDLIKLSGKYLIKNEVKENEFQLWIRKLVRVLFLIIESFIDENETNQNFVANWMDTLLEFIDCNVNAER